MKTGTDPGVAGDWSAAARRCSVATIVAGAVLAVTCAAVALIGPRGPLDDPNLLYLLYTASILVAAIACVARAVLVPGERWAWLLFGFAAASWASGNLYSLVWLSRLEAYPVPSLGDALWLCWYPFVGAGLVLLLRSRVASVPRSLWLDSVVAGCAIAAVYSDVVIGTYLAQGIEGDLTAALTNFAYPLGDLLLLALVISVLAVHGWRLSRGWPWIVTGLVVSTVLDGAYLTGRIPDRMLFGVWPVVALTIERAAWLPGRRVERVLLTGRRIFVVPVMFSLVVLAVLIHSATVPYNPFATGLAAASFLALLVRVSLLFDDMRAANAALEDARGRADRLARIDPLTGVANRRQLGEELQLSVTGADPRVGVLMVDVDHFKQVNDVFGHDAGDVVLVELARRMSGAVRHTDVLCRWGGEEFCILVRDVPDAATLEQVAQNVRSAICSTPVEMADGRSLPVTVSVGAVLMGPSSTADTALQIADQRLYLAKQGGRNQVCSTSEAAPARATGRP